MKQSIFLFAILFCFAGSLSAQIAKEGIPRSWELNNLSSSIPQTVMPAVDVLALLAEDQTVEGKSQPPRFGFDILVNLNLANSGQWENLKNGDRIWRLNIISRGAYSLNLIFDDFWLPEGAELFIYSRDRESLIGSFGHHNNKPYGKFSTTVVKGESIILDYFEPGNAGAPGRMSLNYVIHGYRDVFFKNARGFNDSGSCNINVKCPQSAGWENQINASLLYLLANNTRWCSGSMVNNTAQDGKPYFLSANHCHRNDFATWIFMFNYQSPQCSPNQNGPTNQTVSGSTLRARRSASDFALYELSAQPPAAYNVYLAGWSRSTTAATSGVGIHHPSSDVKKISFRNGALISDGNYWEVPSWSSGTTEPGSSGSPIFDQNKRVVGQLYGGSAACGNNLEDIYGKISVSWDGGSSASSRLKEWLDPGNTQAVFIDGLNPNTPTNALDIAIESVNATLAGPCGPTAAPTAILRNLGSTTVTSAIITYGLAGTTPQTMNWTGSLATNTSTLLTFPTLSLPAGNYDYQVSASMPNGSPDQNPADNSGSFSFSFANGEVFTLTIRTDNYPEETSAQLLNSMGTVVLNIPQGSLTNGATVYTESLCLPYGCYTLNINDSYGDGLCCVYGNGWYLATVNNDTVASGASFTFLDSTSFCFYLPVTCTAPAGLNTTNITATSVRMNWQQATSANAYQIRGRLAGSGQWTALSINNPATSSVDIYNLLPGRTYEWQMRSFCGSDTSAWSNSGFFTMKCSAPTGLNANPVQALAARLNWATQTDVAGYEIRGRVAGSSSGWAVIFVAGGNTGLKDVYGLNPNTTYEWQIRAVCNQAATAKSIWSALSYFTTNSAGRLAGAEDEHSFSVKLYPNPARGTANLSIDQPLFEQASIRLFDLSGRLLWEITGLEGEAQWQIPNPGNQPGLRIIEIQSAYHNWFGKLIFE